MKTHAAHPAFAGPEGVAGGQMRAWWRWALDFWVVSQEPLD